MLTEQQIQERRNYLGASDIPILLEISPWQTPYDLYRFKAYGERSQEVTDVMQIGNFLERGLVDFYSHKHGIAVETGMNTIFHPTKKYLACNLDGRIDKDTIVEVKTGAQYWEDGIPVYYEAQCQWMMHLSGATQCIVIGYIGGRYNEYEIIYNLELCMILEQRADEFWQLVTTQTPPPLASLSDYQQAYTIDDNIQAVAPDEIYAVTEQAKDMYNTRIVATKQEEQLKEQIECYMLENKADALMRDNVVIATYKKRKNSTNRTLTIL
jgi:putative phage-type endonuclease